MKFEDRSKTNKDADYFFLAGIIKVSNLKPLTDGRVRKIYPFPGQPELLIKIQKSRNSNKKHKLAKRVAWRVFKDAQYRNALKEIECELKVAMKIGMRIFDSPLPRMLGVVQTDCGLGIVVEKISGSYNGLAQHLIQICRNEELTYEVLDQLNQFVFKIYDLQIVARDLHAKNVVYGRRGAETDFFLVDGYGERNVVPLRSLSRRLNDRSLNRQFSEIARSTGLIWNSSGRNFEFT